MDQALGVCFGAYRTCPMYHQINCEMEDAEAAAEPVPFIMVTAHGSVVPLRATGT